MIIPACAGQTAYSISTEDGETSVVYIHTVVAWVVDFDIKSGEGSALPIVAGQNAGVYYIPMGDGKVDQPYETIYDSIEDARKDWDEHYLKK
jgi:hypothetical protein